jgi:hyperosmotically inducible periplasmic protein
MGSIGRLQVVGVLGLGLAVLAGCEQKGTMEKAGQKIDKAVEETGKEMQKAGEKAADKLDEAAKKVREATK